MSLDDLVGGPRRSSRPNLVRGQIIAEPLTANDSLRVVLPNFSRDWVYEIPAANWQVGVSSFGASMPAGDELCLVAFDEEGDGWVVAWYGEGVAASW